MWFSSSYEDQLTSISTRITTTQRTLASLNNSKATVHHIALVHGPLLYFSIVLTILIRRGFTFSLLSLKDWLVGAGLPMVIYGLYRLINWLILYRIARAESRLERFKLQHEDKINEIKQKTKYDATLALLARFSDGVDQKSLKREMDAEIAKKRQLIEQLEKQTDPDSLNTNRGTSGWLSGVIESIGGDLGAEHRYALICSCGQHNGLAPPGMKPVQVRYVCPNCGRDSSLAGVHGQDMAKLQSSAEKVENDNDTHIPESSNSNVEFSEEFKTKE